MKIKILHIATDTYGGAGNAMLRLHTSLLSQNVESRVLVRDKNVQHIPFVYNNIEENRSGFFYVTKLGRFIRRHLHKLGIYISDRDFIQEKRKLIDCSVCFTLPISSYDILSHNLVEWADIIHLHWVQDFLDYPSFFSQINKPIIWTCHDLNPMMGGFHHVRLKDKYSLQYGDIELKCYNIKKEAIKNYKNLTIVALSSEMMKLLSAHELYRDRYIYQIPNCVDTSIFRNGNKLELRTRYAINSKAYVVLFANGNLNDTEKGLIELIKALEFINDNRIILLCVGNGIIPQTSINIVHLPKVNDPIRMAEMYQLADILVMPSHQEAFALTPLEAMSCGTPVVITPVSGAKDLIRDFNGVVAKDFSPESISDAINKVLSSIYDANEIRNYIIRNYSLKVVGKLYIDAYSKIIDYHSNKKDLQ